MKVFLSWSGPFSRIVAQHFSQWLPSVIQECHDPYISTETPKGEPWFETVTENLEGCDLGLVFVTPDNMESPWLNFEAGAMLKKFNRSGVCPILVNVKKQVYAGPMKNLQLTEIVDKPDVRLLLDRVNTHCQHPLDKRLLDNAFEQNWEYLARAVADAAKVHGESKPVERGLEDKVDEILTLARQIPNLPSQLVSRERHPSVIARGNHLGWAAPDLPIPDGVEPIIDVARGGYIDNDREWDRLMRMQAFEQRHRTTTGWHNNRRGTVFDFAGAVEQPTRIIVKFDDAEAYEAVPWKDFDPVPF